MGLATSTESICSTAALMSHLISGLDLEGHTVSTVFDGSCRLRFEHILYLNDIVTSLFKHLRLLISVEYIKDEGLCVVKERGYLTVMFIALYENTVVVLGLSKSGAISSSGFDGPSSSSVVNKLVSGFRELRCWEEVFIIALLTSPRPVSSRSLLPRAWRILHLWLFVAT